MNEVMKVDQLPNQKTDVNNRGAFSTDYIGASWDYPDASYQRRAEIWQAHIDYTAGFLYFLAHDGMRSTVTGWPRMNSSIPTTGPTSFTFARRGAWPAAL